MSEGDLGFMIIYAFPVIAVIAALAAMQAVKDKENIGMWFLIGMLFSILLVMIVEVMNG